MPTKPANRALTVKVTGDQLVISIGVEVLAYALQNGPEPFGARIKNAKGFAKDVARQLEDDSNEGDTALQKFFDQMGNLAIESGSQHVVLDGDSEPGIYPPEHSGSYTQRT